LNKNITFTCEGWMGHARE